MHAFAIFKFLNPGSIFRGHVLRCTETSDESPAESKNAVRSTVKLFWEAVGPWIFSQSFKGLCFGDTEDITFL